MRYALDGVGHMYVYVPCPRMRCVLIFVEFHDGEKHIFGQLHVAEILHAFLTLHTAGTHAHSTSAHVQAGGTTHQAHVTSQARATTQAHTSFCLSSSLFFRD